MIESPSMKYARAVILSLFCAVLGAQQVNSRRGRERDVDNHQAEREEWFYGQRAYPLGHIPTGARLNAIQQIEQMDQARAARAQTNLATSEKTASAAASINSAAWTLIGPQPTDQGSTYVTAG